MKIKIASAILLIALVFMTGCSQVCTKKDTKLNMGLSDALKLADTCRADGTVLETGTCNEFTGTWWIDFTPSAPKDGCNPACVVNIENWKSEVNWRCTGLLPEGKNK